MCLRLSQKFDKSPDTVPSLSRKAGGLLKYAITFYLGRYRNLPARVLADALAGRQVR
jgi:hypothetical protein